MKRIFCCFIFLSTLLNASFSFCNADESSLKLMISEVPDNNKSKIIEVKFINVSKQYVAFYNEIFFKFKNVYLDIPIMPISELRFYIDKGNGFERLEYSPKVEGNLIYYNRADPRDFLFLNPKYLWGFLIDLENEFQFDFPKGNYTLKAVYENRSRSWMAKHVTEFFSKEEISDMPTEEHVFDGVIESNSLNIEIGK
jgi:hypothetical protein